MKTYKTEADVTGGQRQGEVGIVPCQLRKDQFELTQAMEFMSDENSVADYDISQYLHHTLYAAMRSLVQDEMGVVQFWAINYEHYPCLSREEYRNLATPPSSASS